MKLTYLVSLYRVCPVSIDNNLISTYEILYIVQSRRFAVDYLFEISWEMALNVSLDVSFGNM
jgi:hypothetical protein